MKCPFCKTELINGEEKKYDTSADHAFDPNYEYERPLRPTFVCPNYNCPCEGKKFWDEWGDFYGRTPKHLFGKILTEAIGSGSRKLSIRFDIQHKNRWIEKMIFWDKTGWKKHRASDIVAKFIIATGLYRVFGYEI